MDIYEAEHNILNSYAIIFYIF